jgi:hypothetical protein
MTEVVHNFAVILLINYIAQHGHFQKMRRDMLIGRYTNVVGISIQLKGLRTVSSRRNTWYVTATI